jgi:multiple sugar transport system ATP-binding protein
MDEPLSNLDAKLRVQTRSEIINIHKNVGATTIYVTHDQTEAMTMADRIVVMKGGYIQQIGAPETIYSDPDNIFVAGFIGNPPMNFLNATFDGKELKVGNLVIETTKHQKEMLVGHPEVVVGIRPESIVLHNDASVSKTHQLLEIGCEFRELLGHEVVIYTHVEGQKLLVKVSSLEPVKAGDTLTIAINPEALYFFDKNTTNRIR